MIPTPSPIEQTIRNLQPPTVLLNGMTHADALKTIATTSGVNTVNPKQVKAMHVSQ